MIVSLDIYGAKLRISKDTVVTYTAEENRKIAVIFKQGEYDAALVKHLNGIVFVQDSIIDNLTISIYKLETEFDKTKESIRVLEANHEAALKDLNKYIKRTIHWRRVATVSIILNVLMVLISLI